ncbi:MAG TPA: hypothetical protein VFG66_13515 [Gemmatimonadales bacterium]|nr:hypothetical protein [Gemmatimonadales bacterium]
MTPATPVAPTRPAFAPGAIAPGGLAPAAGSIRLAAEHFVAATLYLLAGALGLLWVAPELAAGAYLSPHVAGVTHLFTLGWLTMTVFGALCQLLPVALGTPVRSTRLAHAGFWAFAPGVGLFAAGVATSQVALHHAGILLIAVGILLVLSNVGGALPRARTRDVTWAAIALALGFLASTLVLGIVLLHNLHTGFIGGARVRVLATHLHVAIVGWLLMMIVGVSHRLLPMFLLSHGADTSWTRRALALLASGVVVLGTGLTLRQPAAAWAGALLLLGGLGCFFRQAYGFYRARVRKKLDVGMRFVATALAFLATSALLGVAVLASSASHPRLATAYVITGLLGGIVLYVIGFFYKIVPLLAWTARFRGRMGKEPVPTVAQLYSARLGYVQLALMAGGVAILSAGTAAGWAHAARCGAVLFLGGVLVFLAQLGRVARGRGAAA